MTPTQQRNAVSEGTAVGLAILGEFDFPDDKVRIDLAFTGAWRHWDFADRFPQVGTDLAKGLDGILAMTRATEAKKTMVLFWDRGGGRLRIYSRSAPGWDPTSVEDVSFAMRVIDGGVPVEGWVALAQGFLDRFLSPGS